MPKYGISAAGQNMFAKSSTYLITNKSQVYIINRIADWAESIIKNGIFCI